MVQSSHHSEVTLTPPRTPTNPSRPLWTVNLEVTCTARGDAHLDLRIGEAEFEQQVPDIPLGYHARSNCHLEGVLVLRKSVSKRCTSSTTSSEILKTLYLRNVGHCRALGVQNMESE